MTIYIFKTIICSALFLLIYHLFLEKEKMHGFNRFFLLFSIALSLIIPVLAINLKPEMAPVSGIWKTRNNEVISTIVQQYNPPGNYNSPINVFLLLYIVITAFLLCRFIRNILAIIYKIRNSQLISYNPAMLVLTDDQLVPHSFMNYIFIDKESVDKNTIEKEILHHELTHTKQMHSLDVLLVELLLTVMWFNPFLYLYKKAIRLNHEYLADDSVIKTFSDTYHYQLLLLRKASQANSLLLTSRFNYSITKKRLAMLTKTTSRTLAAFKQLALLPVIAVIVFFFSERTIAQDSSGAKKKQPEQNIKRAYVWVGEQTIGSTQEGVSQELLSEYETIIDKYHLLDTAWAKKYRDNMAPEDNSKLEGIFRQMSKEQQQQQAVFFVKPPHPFSKDIPTDKQIASFKNANIYGVWVDGKKVNNAALDRYTNTDFSHVFISKLYGAAKKNVSYQCQVDLMTNTYYKNYYAEAIANTDAIMVITRRFSKNGTGN